MAMKVAMKAMKAAKAMKTMKAMKAMKKSIVATGRLAKVLVFRGSKVRTVGGLKKDSLCKNKHGKVVSKAMSAKGKKSPWIAAVQKARAALKVKGFQSLKKGSALYKKAREFYKK